MLNGISFKEAKDILVNEYPFDKTWKGKVNAMPPRQVFAILAKIISPKKKEESDQISMWDVYKEEMKDIHA